MEIEIQHLTSLKRKRAVIWDGSIVIDIGECDIDLPQETLIDFVLNKNNFDIKDIENVYESYID